jgi:hypothetical protein
MLANSLTAPLRADSSLRIAAAMRRAGDRDSSLDVPLDRVRPARVRRRQKAEVQSGSKKIAASPAGAALGRPVRAAARFCARPAIARRPARG